MFLNKGPGLLLCSQLCARHRVHSPGKVMTQQSRQRQASRAHRNHKLEGSPAPDFILSLHPGSGARLPRWGRGHMGWDGLPLSTTQRFCCSSTGQSPTWLALLGAVGGDLGGVGGIRPPGGLVLQIPERGENSAQNQKLVGYSLCCLGNTETRLEVCVSGRGGQWQAVSAGCLGAVLTLGS